MERYARIIIAATLAGLLPSQAWAQNIDKVVSYNIVEDNIPPYDPVGHQYGGRRCAIDEQGRVYHSVGTNQGGSLQSSNTFELRRWNGDGHEDVLMSSATMLAHPALPPGTTIFPPADHEYERAFDFKVSPDGRVVARVQAMPPGVDMTYCQTACGQFNCNPDRCSPYKVLMSLEPEQVVPLVVANAPASGGSPGEVFGGSVFDYESGYSLRDHPRLTHGDATFDNSGLMYFANLVRGGGERVQTGTDSQGNPIFTTFQGASFKVDTVNHTVTRLTGSNTAPFTPMASGLGATVKAVSPNGQLLFGYSDYLQTYFVSVDGGATMQRIAVRLAHDASVPPEWRGASVSSSLIYTRSEKLVLTDEGKLVAFVDMVDYEDNRQISGLTETDLLNRASDDSASARFLMRDGEAAGPLPSDGILHTWLPNPTSLDGALQYIASQFVHRDGSGRVIFSSFILNAGPGGNEQGFGIFFRGPGGEAGKIITSFDRGLPGLHPDTWVELDHRTGYYVGHYPGISTVRAALAASSNDNGSIAFIMRLRSANSTEEDGQGLFLYNGRTSRLSLVAKTGQTVPGTSDTILSMCKYIPLDMRERNIISSAEYRNLRQFEGDLKSRCLTINDADEVLFAPDTAHQSRWTSMPFTLSSGLTIDYWHYAGSDKLVMLDRRGVLRTIDSGSPAVLQAILGRAENREAAQFEIGELFMPDNFNNEGEFVLKYRIRKELPLNIHPNYPFTEVPSFEPQEGLIRVSFRDTAPLCRADYNSSGGLSVQDVFDYLADWQARVAAADYNQDGATTLQDLFDFIAAFMTGCGGPLMAPPDLDNDEALPDDIRALMRQMKGKPEVAPTPIPIAEPSLDDAMLELEASVRSKGRSRKLVALLSLNSPDRGVQGCSITLTARSVRGKVLKRESHRFAHRIVTRRLLARAGQRRIRLDAEMVCGNYRLPSNQVTLR